MQGLKRKKLKKGEGVLGNYKKINNSKTIISKAQLEEVPVSQENVSSNLLSGQDLRSQKFKASPVNVQKRIMAQEENNISSESDLDDCSIISERFLKLKNESFGPCGDSLKLKLCPELEGNYSIEKFGVNKCIIGNLKQDIQREGVQANLSSNIEIKEEVDLPAEDEFLLANEVQLKNDSMENEFTLNYYHSMENNISNASRTENSSIQLPLEQEEYQINANLPASISLPTLEKQTTNKEIEVLQCTSCNLRYNDLHSAMYHIYHQQAQGQICCKGQYLVRMITSGPRSAPSKTNYIDSYVPNLTGNCVKFYNCEFCKQTFCSKELLEGHKLRHEGDTLICRLCNVFLALEEYEEHQKSHFDKFFYKVLIKNKESRYIKYVDVNPKEDRRKRINILKSRDSFHGEWTSDENGEIKRKIEISLPNEYDFVNNTNFSKAVQPQFYLPMSESESNLEINTRIFRRTLPTIVRQVSFYEQIPKLVPFRPYNENEINALRKNNALPLTKLQTDLQKDIFRHNTQHPLCTIVDRKESKRQTAQLQTRFLQDNSGQNVQQSTDLCNYEFELETNKEELEIQSQNDSDSDSGTGNSSRNFQKQFLLFVNKRISQKQQTKKQAKLFMCNNKKAKEERGNRLFWYRCAICDRFCKDRGLVLKHMRSSHLLIKSGKGVPYTAKKAFKVCGKAELREVFMCHICSTDFNTETECIIHMNMSHYCTHCYRTFFKKELLDTHLLEHERLHSCNSCNESFITEEKLESHKLTHENHCAFCNDENIAHSKISCNIGDVSFHTPYLIKHQRQFTRATSGSSTHHCNFCGKTKFHMEPHKSKQTYSCTL